jgi:hypothetical protein
MKRNEQAENSTALKVKNVKEPPPKKSVLPSPYQNKWRMNATRD